MSFCFCQKLQKLVVLNNLVGRKSESVEDPAELEVEVARPDGSLVAKKFRDCSWRELQSATRHRKQARKSAGRAIRKARTLPDYAPILPSVPKLPSPVLWRPLAMIGLGVLAGFVGGWLLPSLFGAVSR